MGRPTQNLVGRRFGSLTVVERAENPNSRQTKWLCKCDCGNTCAALSLNLKAGRTTSCGCKRKGEMSEVYMRQAPSESLERLTMDEDDPYQNLANAIVAVAVDDYRDALKKGNKRLTQSLEEFFHSSWYRLLTSIDAEDLIHQVRKEQNRQPALAACV